MFLAAGISVFGIMWSSCGRKSNITGSAGDGSYGPQRLAGSPYPISQKPDTLFVVDESKLSYTQTLTVESLQGVLAQSKPRIYVINGSSDSYENWLADLVNKYGVFADYSFSSDFNGLLNHFKSDVKGYILATTQEPSIDVAFSMAGATDAMVVIGVDQPTVAALGIPLLADATNESYEQFMTDYQASMNKLALCFQTADDQKAQYLPDYAIFGKMFFYYGDISTPQHHSCFHK